MTKLTIDAAVSGLLKLKDELRLSALGCDDAGIA